MKMYKLFTTQITKRTPSHNVYFIPKQIIMHRSMRLCSFCNFYHGKISKFLIHRQIHSSITTVNLLSNYPLKKRIKQRTRKYAELLEVTDQATNKRAIVQKLKAHRLSMFVNQPGVNIDNLYTLRDPALNKVSHSEPTNNKKCPGMYNNKVNVNVENITDTSNNEMNLLKKSSEGLEEESSYNKATDDHTSVINEKEVIGNKTHKILKLSKKSMMPSKEYKESNQDTNKHVAPHYTKNLLVYMQVYLSCGLLNRANKILMKYRHYKKNQLRNCKECIELYNMLLEAYASKGQHERVFELYALIVQDSVAPTPQTYAYILDAIGRKIIKQDQIVKVLEKLKLEMDKNNISFNDIFNKSLFKNDQRENVLKSVRLIIPEFEPSYTALNTEYTCQLLKKISMEGNYQSPVKGLLEIKELKDVLKIQLQNESMVEVQIKSIYKDNRSMNTINKSKQKVMEIETYWKDIAVTAFNRNLKCLKEKESHIHNSLMVLHPFLEVLDEQHYVNGILREIRFIAQESENYSVPLKVLYINLGKYIYTKYEIQTKKQTGVLDKVVSVYLKYMEWYLHSKSMTKLNKLNDRTVWQYLEWEEEKHGTSLGIMCLNWPMDVLIKVGKFLYDIILNDIILQPAISKRHEFKRSIPAFYTLFRNNGNYLVEQIKPHPLVSKLYKESQLDVLTFNTIHVPSIAPPRPWTSIHTGGYLIATTDFIRVPIYTSGPWLKLQKTPTQQLFPVLDSLTQLGTIPWTINSAILDIVIEIFQQGGSIKLNVPQSVSALVPPTSISKNASLESKRNAAKAVIQYKEKKQNTYSLWCDALYRLSLANHFRNKIFWLPHNIDFRGRVYPVPPHLNHLSSDLGRSLLLFAKGKPLGPNGLDWLKLHVINLTDFKKGCPMEERLEYANQNMENILDSATNPMTGKMWWAQSEEPWQTLAGCMEIANALKAPNIEEYESKFPVHQDGSCNGLQHYAALGRDQIGAESVNLHPSDSPQDVYTAVATKIETQRKIDARNDVKVAQLLEGFIKRKIIKQTVMTTVYGVTRYGARLQILKQLKELEEFPEEHMSPASTYLTEKTFHTLKSMFQSAREIQDWFTTCAKIISSVCCQNVEWITPLGLPVMQPYIKYKKTSNMYDKGIEKPDPLKQKNAFAPNFIHSLDSTHMMLTSLHCKEANITFVSVHDCFWTHACTVDLMNKICREQFVALHSEPILEDLAKFFIQHYEPVYTQLQSKNINVKQINKCLISVPEKGTFDIKNVLSSKYFFS